MTNTSQILATAVNTLLQNDHHALQQVMDWHLSHQFQYAAEALYVCEELKAHSLLWIEKKVQLLINMEFLLASAIRRADKSIQPQDWQATEDLEMLWLQPTEGHLPKLWRSSDSPEDTLKLLEFQNSSSFRYRGLDKTQAERLTARLQKLENAIAQQRMIIFLGRQTNVYRKLIKALNAQEGTQYVSDHSWSSLGFTEPGMKTSDNRLSVIQACETVRRLPALFPLATVAQKSRIMFSLDGYDVFHALSAIYSDCNKIARSRIKPCLPPLTHFEFAHTGLTDLELANIARHKDWFRLTSFCRTSEAGKPEMLSVEQVAGEYGIICLDK